jgi:N-acyl-D-aspartate/D-glutamate deacylase
VLSEKKRGLMQITIGKEFFMPEMERISRERGVPVTWTALLAGLAGPGSHRRYLDGTARQKANGAHVIPQVSCRPLNFEFNFADPFPFEILKIFNELSAADAKEPGARLKAYADPAFRRRFKEELLPNLRFWWERAVIATAPGAPELEEQNLGAVAKARGVDATDLALDLSLASNLGARFRLAVLNHDESEVAELLKDDQVVVALSDAGAHASQLCDACYATYLLKHWVRETGTLSLEQAVHMLTAKPAEIFGIKDRGLLKEGRPADVVVFDPATVGDGKLQRVHDQPAGADRLISQASGIEAVIVNGTLLRRNGQDAVLPNAKLPGRLLRAGMAA